MICSIDGCINKVHGRGLCAFHYRKWYKYKDPLYKKEKSVIETCIVDGCNRDATRKSSRMCEKHYYRVRRNGTVDLMKIKAKEVFINQAGYIKDLCREHPLSDSTGYVYRHRKVLFDSNPKMICVHCGKPQQWENCHVDHLDDNIKNNSLSNLGISCPLCNMNRGRKKLKQSLRDKYAVHEYNGELLCLSEWGERPGVTCTSMIWRLKHWTDRDKIFTQPRGNSGPKSCHSKKTIKEREERG